jgi:hypothetical protein
MSPSRRKALRFWAWVALIISLPWDGAFGENAIAPDSCWIGFDMLGQPIDMRSWTSVWLPVIGLVLFQSF